jgi:hypothetical protein
MENIDNEVWKILPEYEAKLTLEDSKFIFERAEKSFNDTIDTSKRILERSSSLLTLVSGLMVAMVAYSVKKWVDCPAFDSILITTMLAIVYLFVLGIFYIFPNIKPKLYTLPGTEPKKYFVEALFNATPPPQGRVLFLYINEIRNLQKGITNNSLLNKKKWRRYKTALNLVFASPLIFIGLYLITRIFVNN